MFSFHQRKNKGDQDANTGALCAPLPLSQEQACLWKQVWCFGGL